MKKKLAVVFLMILAVVLSVGSASAKMELVTPVYKVYKTLDFPHDIKIVMISVVTRVDYLRGNEKASDFERARQLHTLLVSEYKKTGWNEEDFTVEDLDVGNVEMVITEGLSLKWEKTLRMKVFLYMCKNPMKKYRGEDVKEFFKNKVVSKSVEAFTHDYRLIQKR